MSQRARAVRIRVPARALELASLEAERVKRVHGVDVDPRTILTEAISVGMAIVGAPAPLSRCEVANDGEVAA